jgi:hypothetical protein
MKFEINDSYTDDDKARKSRLDLFKLPQTANYQKILYIDTNTLVKDDIQQVFDVCQTDVLYVLEEGTIDSDTDVWGCSLFSDELTNYSDKSAFTCETMLFNNCDQIRQLFDKINEDIIHRPNYFSGYDQPYIIYNAFKTNLYDNQALKPFVVNNDQNTHGDKVIYHFSMGPGIYQQNLTAMQTFLNDIKEITIVNNIAITKKYIDDYLMPIIIKCNEPLEGNIFMYHLSTTYTDLFINKCKNISNLVLNQNVTDVMEIGFNSGFSTLLMLMSNPNIRITCFDIGYHSYTIPCFNKLKETFGDRINIVIGDSRLSLTNVQNVVYDLIHIDGGHLSEVCLIDIINSYRLSKHGTMIIMDDYDFSHLHDIWDIYSEFLGLQKLNIYTYESIHHDIKYVVK